MRLHCLKGVLRAWCPSVGRRFGYLLRSGLSSSASERSRSFTRFASRGYRGVCQGCRDQRDGHSYLRALRARTRVSHLLLVRGKWRTFAQDIAASRCPRTCLSALPALPCVIGTLIGMVERRPGVGLDTGTTRERYGNITGMTCERATDACVCPAVARVCVLVTGDAPAHQSEQTAASACSFGLAHSPASVAS